MQVDEHKKAEKKVGMQNPMHDKNEDKYRGGGGGTCDHGLSRRSLRVNLVLRVELERTIQVMVVPKCADALNSAGMLGWHVTAFISIPPLQF